MSQASHTNNQPIRITCITRSHEIEPLVRKYAHWGNVQIQLTFHKKYEEFRQEDHQRGDILLADVGNSEYESAFFTNLRNNMFKGMMIVAMCPGSSAQEWHSYVLDKQITDYLVIRPLYDANRLRVQLRHLLELSGLIRLFEGLENVEGSGLQGAPFMQELSHSPFSMVRGIAEYSRLNPNFVVNLQTVSQGMDAIQTSVEVADKSVRAEEHKSPNLHESAKTFHLSALLVEDSATDAEIIKRILTSQGIGVTHSFSYDAATKDHRGRTFDLAILDLVVPGTNGAAGIKALKNELNLKSTPLLVTSSYAEDSRIKELAALGISGFLIKPVSRNNLIQKVTAVMKKVKAASLV